MFLVKSMSTWVTLAQKLAKQDDKTVVSAKTAPDEKKKRAKRS
jgi:hypothetical protein